MDSTPSMLLPSTSLTSTGSVQAGLRRTGVFVRCRSRFASEASVMRKKTMKKLLAFKPEAAMSNVQYHAAKRSDWGGRTEEINTTRLRGNDKDAEAARLPRKVRNDKVGLPRPPQGVEARNGFCVKCIRRWRGVWGSNRRGSG